MYYWHNKVKLDLDKKEFEGVCLEYISAMPLKKLRKDLRKVIREKENYKAIEIVVKTYNENDFLINWRLKSFGDMVSQKKNFKRRLHFLKSSFDLLSDVRFDWAIELGKDRGETGPKEFKAYFTDNWYKHGEYLDKAPIALRHAIKKRIEQRKKEGK
ncbi:MAG: hypothetical protein ACRCUM_03875 [Mycoplasmoidaceae bacterium]